MKAEKRKKFGTRRHLDRKRVHAVIAIAKDGLRS